MPGVKRRSSIQQKSQSTISQCQKGCTFVNQQATATAKSFRQMSTKFEERKTSPRIDLLKEMWQNKNCKHSEFERGLFVKLCVQLRKLTIRRSKQIRICVGEMFRDRSKRMLYYLSKKGFSHTCLDGPGGPLLRLLIRAPSEP